MKYRDPYQENQNKQNKKNKQDATRNRYHTDTTEDLLCTSSATDCTGLIPAGITDQELDAYEQLYPYLPIRSGDTTDRK